MFENLTEQKIIYKSKISPEISEHIIILIDYDETETVMNETNFHEFSLFIQLREEKYVDNKYCSLVFPPKSYIHYYVVKLPMNLSLLDIIYYMKLEDHYKLKLRDINTYLYCFDYCTHILECHLAHNMKAFKLKQKYPIGCNYSNQLGYINTNLHNWTIAKNEDEYNINWEQKIK